MLESDWMANVDDVEMAARAIGLRTKRVRVRSLEAIQVMWNGSWTPFDPVNRSEDLTKLLWAGYVREFGMVTERDFRIIMVREIAKQ